MDKKVNILAFSGHTPVWWLENASSVFVPAAGKPKAAWGCSRCCCSPWILWEIIREELGLSGRGTFLSPWGRAALHCTYSRIHAPLPFPGNYQSPSCLPSWHTDWRSPSAGGSRGDPPRSRGRLCRWRLPGAAPVPYSPQEPFPFLQGTAAAEHGAVTQCPASLRRDARLGCPTATEHITPHMLCCCYPKATDTQGHPAGRLSHRHAGHSAGRLSHCWSGSWTPSEGLVPPADKLPQTFELAKLRFCLFLSPPTDTPQNTAYLRPREAITLRNRS